MNRVGNDEAIGSRILLLDVAWLAYPSPTCSNSCRSPALCKAQQPLPSSFLLSVQTRTLDMLFAFGFLHEAQRAEAYKARSPVWH